MRCDRLINCCESHLMDESVFECDRLQDCIVLSDTRKEIKCTEKGKSYYYFNDSERKVILHHMDGGVISDSSQKKCDYLLSISNNKDIIAILLELKGKDIWHALEQISVTLDTFNNYFRKCECTYGRIVLAQTSPKIMADPKVVKLKKKLSRLHGDLKIRSKTMEEKEADLFG